MADLSSVTLEIIDKIKRYGFKSIFHGAMSAAEIIFILQDFDNVSFFGNSNIPPWVPLSIAGALGAFGTELFHDFLFDTISSDDKLKEPASAIVGILSAGVLGCIALKIMSNIPMERWGMSIMVLALAYAGNEFLYSNLLNPSIAIISGGFA